MSFLRALGIVIVGLELLALAAIRTATSRQSVSEYPVSTIVTVALCLVVASFVVLLVRSSPPWLVWIALFLSGLPLVFGWLFLSILTGIAGK